MDEGKLFGRGISFPPRIGDDGRMVWSTGSQNIRESIQVILLTEALERMMLPEFGGGLRGFLFKPNVVSVHRLMEERIVQALGRWEPRISVEAVTIRPDSDDQEVALITIRYKLVSTQVSEQISMTVNLTG